MLESCLASALVVASLATSLSHGSRPAITPPERPQSGIFAPSRPAPGFRSTVLRSIVGPRGITRLTRRAPVLGGRWYVGSARDVRFIGANTVSIDYEDGHVAGRITARIVDPSDVSTWRVIRDEAR